MKSLPEGWKSVNIDSIAEIISGGTPSSKNPEYFTEEHEQGIAWITPADLSNYKNQYIAHGKRSITQSGYDSCSAKLMPKGAVLFSSRAPIGYVAIALNEISTNQGFKSFVPHECTDTQYLYYYLKSIKHLAESLATGTTFKELSGKVAKTLPFPLAPLPEQKRIVAKLDEVLAQVDTIKARLDGIPAILKRFRQSVLAAAVSGKLTEEWRGISEHDLIDFNEIASMNFEQRKLFIDGRIQKAKPLEQVPTLKLPTSWSWCSIDDCALKITDGTHHSPDSFPEGDFMYVTSKNVREGFIDLSNITYVTKETHKDIYSRCDVKLGDVLYVKDGANTGLSCVNNISEQISLLSSVGVIKVTSYMDAKYLQHYLNSPIGRKLMLDKMGGTAIKRLTLKKIKESPVSVPPIEEQKEIVRLVDQYFTFADTIEAQVKKAQARVDNLTQSILAKAFRGELVPQDPADEPAEVLLARIAQARKEAEALTKAAKKAAKAPRKTASKD